VLGSRIHHDEVVHGGDVAAAYRIDLVDGRRLFAKTHPAPPPGFFTTEAAGLTWLREPGAVAVPEVVAVSDGAPDGAPSFLVLEWIQVAGRARPGSGLGAGTAGGGRVDTESDVGRRLAGLHRAGAPCFGREDRRTTGSRALPNDPCATWAEFYGERRLRPLARLAADGGALPPRAIAGLERLADGLAAFGAADEPPARLHGDLWAGNRLVDGEGRNWLVDPAAHGGHREFDLAMMRLFGGFGPSCFDAYDESFPLAEGWQLRVSLHQIAPLVVHALKFGGSYVAAACDAIDRYVSTSPRPTGSQPMS
jgi:fructosamine-3-kinase